MPTGFDRSQHHAAHQVGLVSDRHQVPIGERCQEPPWRAFVDAQHDQARVGVERIVGNGVLPFGLAVLAGEIFVREQCNNSGSGRQRRVHALHEVAVGEVPLLKYDPVPGALNNTADRLRERRVGAGPADEEIRRGIDARLWRQAQTVFPASGQLKLKA
jgi:hypothetical protein